jgi:hypothetical protein
VEDYKRVIFEFCSDSDIHLVNQAIEKWVKAGHILAINHTIQNFQHKLTHGYSYILAKKEGMLVGILGYIPTYLYDSELEKDLQYSTVTWFIDLKANVPGLGMLLFRSLLSKKRGSFCYAISISEQAFPMHEALAYKIGWMHQVYIVNHTLNKFKLLQNAPVIKELVSEKNYSIQQLHLDDFDEVTTGFRGPQNVVPTKSAAYFKNRFLMHPIYHYLVHGIFQKGLLKAIIAMRLVASDGAIAIRLVDFSGKLNALYNIAPELQELLIQEKAEYLDLYHWGLDQKALEQGGFLLRSKDGQTIVPNYFEPFEAFNVELNYAYRFMKKTDNRNVLLFKADSDQDRPS